MVILRTRNKITDFFMILAWASHFKVEPTRHPRIACPLPTPQPTIMKLGKHRVHHSRNLEKLVFGHVYIITNKITDF